MCLPLLQLCPVESSVYSHYSIVIKTTNIFLSSMNVSLYFIGDYLVSVLTTIGKSQTCYVIYKLWGICFSSGKEKFSRNRKGSRYFQNYLFMSMVQSPFNYINKCTKCFSIQKPILLLTYLYSSLYDVTDKLFLN